MADIYTETWRRKGWFLKNSSPRKIHNLLNACLQFTFPQKRISYLPPILKIDISPLCNLNCITCIHANPNLDPDLAKQRFTPEKLMPLKKYHRIIEEVKGIICVVLLYYMGEPYIHPDIDEMCRIARDAGLNIHLSTNFSFNFTDERITAIAESGVTHLTICVDGLTQETYSRTRINGRIDDVLSNLTRLCEYKRIRALNYPIIEVQYIKYQHNLHELKAAGEMFKSMRVDKFTKFWGNLHNMVDLEPGKYKIFKPRKKRMISHCLWPSFFMLIKYNGDAFPCCLYRFAAQYCEMDNSRALGNVFETSVEEVWNSTAFRQTRKFVFNPDAALEDESFMDNFCYGCEAIFHTDLYKVKKEADKYRIEEIYPENRD